MIWILFALYVLVIPFVWSTLDDNFSNESLWLKGLVLVFWPIWGLIAWLAGIYNLLLKLWDFIKVKFSDTYLGQKLIIRKWNKYDFKEDLVRKNATRLLKNSKKIARRKLLKEYLEARLNEQ